MLSYLHPQTSELSEINSFPLKVLLIKYLVRVVRKVIRRENWYGHWLDAPDSEHRVLGACRSVPRGCRLEKPVVI